MKPLDLVHAEKEYLTQPASKSDRIPFVDFALHGSELHAWFKVRGHKPFVNAGLSTHSSQWGLWDWDVVELFVGAGKGPYYEFQVSPLNQFFELEIFEPRKKVNKDFTSGFTHEATRIGPDEWGAVMKIPLKAIGWDGRRESLRGNAFAILGEPKARSYWSLFLPKQDQPDFHLPQYFAPLL